MNAYEKLQENDLTPSHANPSEDTQVDTPVKNHNPSFHDIYDEPDPQKEAPQVAIQVGTEDLEVEMKKLEGSITIESYQKYIERLYVIILATCLFTFLSAYLGVTNWDVFGYLSILGLVNIINCALVIGGIKTRNYIVMNLGALFMVLFTLFLLGAAIYLHLASQIFVAKPKIWICLVLWIGFAMNLCIIWPAVRVRNVLDDILDIKERIQYRRLGMSGSVVAPGY